MRIPLIYIISLISSGLFAQVEYVNPFIGTGGHGHTYPGATLPFGMVQLSPDTRLEGWDGCSAYHYTDSIIYGFSHTHLSGTGVSDYGDILFMPTTGKIQFNNGYKTGVDNGYASRFTKINEIAEAGFYYTYLDDYNIGVELTSTQRTGIHKYTFKNQGDINIILDLQHRDLVLKKQIRIVSNQAITGRRISRAWATEQHVYYYAEFSKPYNNVTYNKDSSKAVFTFTVDTDESLILKVGISAVDENGAKLNLHAEAPHWDFDSYRSDARNKWNDALKVIGVNESDLNKKTIFYTALYHNLIVPNVYSDVDGNYRGMDMNIHTDTSQSTYTVFSLWDTFRATHPLYTIIEQKRTIEFINTFLKHYEQSGLLPVWELAGNETNCMIGFHSASVIADAYVKGLRNFNLRKAVDASMKSSQEVYDYLDWPASNYLSASMHSESVSKTLEYAYDDWCVQLLIDSVNNNTEIGDRIYIKSKFAYKNLFDKKTGFMRPRKNGGWFGNFDPTEVNFHFTEANSWQYSMFVPHNISDLIDLHGGEDNFELKLDQLFMSSSDMGGRHQSDITGLIGQYAHGNEPSHHMAYLYNYIGKPWKTQKRVRQILSEMYSNAPDGLSGNEDCGQMSAWYIFSAMGFYPVTPGLPYYTIGSPLFNELHISLENGNTFKIISNNNSEENIYIQAATLNGLNHPYSYIHHSEIMKGGELIFEMGAKPNKAWGLLQEHRPISKIKEEYMPAPLIISESQTFEDSLKIELKCHRESAKLKYEISYPFGLKHTQSFNYSEPFYIKNNCAIQVTAYDTINGKYYGNIESGIFKKIKQDRTIELRSEYANQYAASGNDALIDQLRGSNNFRTGDWQGYQGQDIEAVITFDSERKLNKISLGCLQDIQSWIWYPKNVKYYISKNNKDWTHAGTVVNSFSDNEYGAFTQELTFTKKVKTKYLKIVAETYGVCPEWHLGNGGKAWIFVDEIIIE